MPLDWNKFKNEFENKLKPAQTKESELLNDSHDVSSQMDDILYEALQEVSSLDHKMELMKLYVQTCMEEGVDPKINLQRLLDRLDLESAHDQLEAVIYYTTAAELGDPQAQCNLGFYYEQGLCGLEKNSQLALEYCEAAAEQGFAPAQYNLGVYYEKGLCGLEKNSELALEYYKAAAKQGFAPAQYYLGVCYEQGLLGLEKNSELALEYYKAAAKQGFAPAQYDLGVCYEQGLLGLKENSELALSYYEAAAKQGFAQAQYYLGVCYEQGLLGLKENSELALSYYEAAAEQGSEQAQYYLGVCYEKGLLGLEENSWLAQEYYNKAAEQAANAEDIEALSNLKDRLEGNNSYSESETESEVESETDSMYHSENPLNPPIAAQVSSVNVVVAHSTTSLSPGSAETTLQQLSIQMQNLIAENDALRARVGRLENRTAPQILMQNLEARLGIFENYIAPQILFDNIEKRILAQSTNQREYITAFKSTCSQIYTKYLMAMSGVSGKKGNVITILLKALALIPGVGVAGEAMQSVYDLLNARKLKINASNFLKLVPTTTELDELARRLAIFMALHHKGLNDLPQRPNRLKSIINGISYSGAEQLAINDAIKMMASVLAAQEEVSSLEVESFVLKNITYTEAEKAKYGVEEPAQEKVLEYVRAMQDDPNKFIALCYNKITQESVNPVKIEVDNWCSLPAYEGNEVKVRLSYSTVSSAPETANEYYNQPPSSSLGLG
jgi:TPR repeat protein